MLNLQIFILLIISEFIPVFSFTLLMLLGYFNIAYAHFCVFSIQRTEYVWSLLRRLWAQAAGGPWHWRIPAWTPSVSGGLALHARHHVTALTSTHHPEPPHGRARLTEILFPETPGCSSVTATSYLPRAQADWVDLITLIHLNHQRVSFKNGLQVLSNAKGFVIRATQRQAKKSQRGGFGLAFLFQWKIIWVVTSWWGKNKCESWNQLRSEVELCTRLCVFVVLWVYFHYFSFYSLCTVTFTLIGIHKVQVHNVEHHLKTMNIVKQVFQRTCVWERTTISNNEKIIIISEDIGEIMSQNERLPIGESRTVISSRSIVPPLKALITHQELPFVKNMWLIRQKLCSASQIFSKHR